MAAPATNTEFLELVSKSGVADNEKLDAHVAYLRKSGTLPPGPKKLAGVLVRDGILTRFQAEQIMLGKWRRFTIGKYKVLERLGSGGMGSVYLCEHKLMRRRVAVKVLPTAKAADPSSLERFYREARAVAALDHPNIVHAYDIDQDGPLHFLVMEYVDGASLQEIVKRHGQLEPLRAAHYIHNAALGLQHAHQAGLVHRDIKPGNVLVDRTGVVKLLDMGLARFFNDEDDILTKKYDENVLGTADYLAPEQALDSHTVDIRADIYGLGATFYFLLSGQTPFGEGTVAQKLIWHQTRQPKSLKEYRQDVPDGMLAVIEKMMAKDPNDRYPVPLDVAEALEPWTQSEIAPPSDSEMPRLSLAATGNPSSEPTVVSAKSRAGASSSKSWQVNAPSSGSKSPSSVSTEHGVSEPPSSGPSILSPEQTGPPMPDSFWSDMTSDTDGAGDKDDTASRSESIRIQTSPAEERAKRAEQSPTLIILLMGALLFVGGLGAGIYMYFFGNSDTDTPTRPPLIVSANQNGSNHYPSIQAALANAKNGDVIEIDRSEIQENIIIDHRKNKGVTAVTVRAAKGRSVVWRTATADSAVPLLRISDARGFHLDGKGILFDGSLPQRESEKSVSRVAALGLLATPISPSPLLAAATLHPSSSGNVQDLVKLYFHCPGLRLSGAEFQNYYQSAIHISNFTGDESKPAVLEKLHFQSIPDVSLTKVKEKKKRGKNWRTQIVEKDTGKGGAILIKANKNISPTVNDLLRIDNCHFIGIWDSIAIRIEGEDVISEYVREHLPTFVRFPAKQAGR